MRGSVVEGRGRVKKLSGPDVARLHKYVVCHHKSTADMRRYEYHCILLVRNSLNHLCVLQYVNRCQSK